MLSTLRQAAVSRQCSCLPERQWSRTSAEQRACESCHYLAVLLPVSIVACRCMGLRSVSVAPRSTSSTSSNLQPCFTLDLGQTNGAQNMYGVTPGWAPPTTSPRPPYGGYAAAGVPGMSSPVQAYLPSNARPMPAVSTTFMGTCWGTRWGSNIQRGSFSEESHGF
eukprot:s5113_g1.t2